MIPAAPGVVFAGYRHCKHFVAGGVVRLTMLVTVLTNVSCSTTTAQSATQLDIASDVIVPAIIAIDAAETRIRSIWEGFWVRPGFGIYDVSFGIIAYGDTSMMPKGLRRLDFGKPSDRVRDRTKYYRGSWNYLNGGVQPLIPTLTAGSSVPAELEVPSDGNPIPVAVPVPRQANLIEFTIHESFHAYQLAKFVGFFDAMLAANDPLPREHTGIELEQLRQERRLVLNLIEADGGEALRRVARAYLLRRSTRMEMTSEVEKALETRRERIEGTATFVGLKASVVVHTRDPSAFRSTLAQAVVDRWDVGNSDMIRQLNQRSYVTGAAIAFALETLAVKDWQQSVENGRQLDDLLSAAVQ